MHHVGFVKGFFVNVAFDVDHRSLRERRQQFVRGLGFINHFAFNAAAAHPAFAFINRREVGVRHPRGVKVDGFHIQGFLDVVRVVQQTIIGGVGDHRVHRPGRVRGFFYALRDGRMLEFALRNTAEDTVGVTRRAEVDWRNVAHHHQMGQRFMAVTVNQYGATCWRRVHPDDFVSGRGPVRHHVAAFRVEDASDVLFRFFVRAAVVQQRTKFRYRNGDIGFHGIGTKEIVEDAADRAFLERGTAHMAWRTEGIFAFTYVFKQRFGQRRQNGVDILVSILFDFIRNIFRGAQRIFEEANLHPQIVETDVQR